MNVNRSDGNNNPAAISRRDFLWAGTAGAVGLGLSRAGQAAWADVAGARCDAVILLWMQGGVSHLDTFDPKPDAPSEIHGPFKAIGTNVPGIQLCEHLPRMARIADKIAFIRSMRHGEGAHERAKSHVLSGCKPLPGVIHPDIGSVVSEELGRRGLQLPQKDVAELPSRSVMCAAGERETLELAKEPEKVRDAYGDSSLGRKCLLARRLVEAGARFVMVDEGGWDHHFRAFDSLVTRLPQFDRAVSALLADLADRGLFDR
ncbi:MAG: DUF1501 domain-containing protein, partial [Verrucomicrobia bacterium]|nr:DUF1501 domain-containing protein [Verrucomicrobiota bacterium]